MQDGMIADLKASYGLTCHRFIPVTGGWLNRKWKISTDEGELLVKQFSNERCSREKLELIESALQRQIIVEKEGVPCPAIRQYKGRAIRLMEDGTAYMVMDFCPGRAEGPDTITIPQMRSLGSACGLMHKAFSHLPASSSVEGYPIDSKQVIDSLWTHFHAGLRESSSGAPAGYREAVLAQEPVLKRLTPGFFDKLPKGIGHEDFSADNILFEEAGLSAIVDFDRNHYGYVWHDAGRAILSFALEGGRLNGGKIAAFLEGYSQHRPLALPDMADVLRLSWCVEMPWWIRPEFFGGCSREKVARFREEILWLTEHWFELDALLRP